MIVLYHRNHIDTHVDDPNSMITLRRIDVFPLLNVDLFLPLLVAL
jgi:hypothetical protein